MSRHRPSLRNRAALLDVPPDFYVVPRLWPRLGRPVKHDVSTWRVLDDWPARVPVPHAEIDVFEAWVGGRMPYRANRVHLTTTIFGLVPPSGGGGIVWSILLVERPPGGAFLRRAPVG